jgi:hypothetical protein
MLILCVSGAFRFRRFCTHVIPDSRVVKVSQMCSLEPTTQVNAMQFLGNELVYYY